MATSITQSDTVRAFIAALGQPVFIENDTLHVRCMSCGQAEPVELHVTSAGQEFTSANYELRSMAGWIEGEFKIRAPHSDCKGAEIVVPLGEDGHPDPDKAYKKGDAP